MVAPSTTNALIRLLAPVARWLTPESAKRLIDLELDAPTKNRIEELASKSASGSLSESERAEYMEYVEAIDLIGILQAEAKQLLLRPTGS